MRKAWFVFVILVGVLSACKGKREIVLPDNNTEKGFRLNQLMDSIDYYSIHPEWFNSRMSTDFTFKGESTSLKANIKIRKDSLIYATISYSNVPVALMQADKDSVWVVIKRGEKGYMVESFEDLSYFLGSEINLNIIEDFFLGNPISFSKEEKYKMEIDSNLYLISNVRKRKAQRMRQGRVRKDEIIEKFWIRPGDYRPEKVTVYDPEDTAMLKIEYREYEMLEEMVVPKVSYIEFTKPGDTVSILFDYGRTKLNEPQSINFNIPEGYYKKQLIQEDEQ